MAAEPLTKKGPPWVSDRGASTSCTIQHVVVTAPSTPATIINIQERSTTQNIAPPKDVLSNSFSFALQNILDAIP